MTKVQKLGASDTAIAEGLFLNLGFCSGFHLCNLTPQSLLLSSLLCQAASIRLRAGSAFLPDNDSAPSSGNFNLRIVNATPGLGSSLDVYVVQLPVNLSGLSPTFAGLAVGSASAYGSLAAGNWEVVFTNPGTQNIILDSTPLSFSAGQVRTLLAPNSPAGGSTTTVLADLN